MCPHGTLLVDKTCYSGMSIDLLVMFIQTTLGILHSALSLASLYIYVVQLLYSVTIAISV